MKIITQEIKNQSLVMKDMGERDGRYYISGWGAVFTHKDHQNDIITENAFSDFPALFNNARNKTIKQNRLPMLYEHKDLIGVWEKAEIKTMDKISGLYLSGYIDMSIPNSKSIVQKIKNNVLTGLSIAFILQKYSLETDPDTKQKLRYILKANPVECSLVALGAQPLAHIYINLDHDSHNSNTSKPKPDNTGSTAAAA